MFRLYAPTKALFDKTWKLPDVEEIAASTQPETPTAAADGKILVTADNFIRAETDLYFAVVAKRSGLGASEHNRVSGDASWLSQRSGRVIGEAPPRPRGAWSPAPILISIRGRRR